MKGESISFEVVSLLAEQVFITGPTLKMPRLLVHSQTSNITWILILFRQEKIYASI